MLNLEVTVFLIVSKIKTPLLKENVRKYECGGLKGGNWFYFLGEKTLSLDELICPYQNASFIYSVNKFDLPLPLKDSIVQSPSQMFMGI